MTLLARFSAAAITGAAKAITGARSIWLGCDPVPVQRIYFANHSSHSDFVLLWAALPPLLRKRTRPVAGADYWSTGAVRPYVIHQVFNGVLVDRASGKKPTDHPTSSVSDTKPGEMSDALADGVAPPFEAHEEGARIDVQAVKPDALAPLKAALDAGDSLIIFPEGTRNMQDGLLPFKSGIYHLAKAYPHVEIVPVWLGNLNRVMPKGALLPLPLLCTVSFGKPLQVQAGEEKEGFLSRARNALLQLAGIESGSPAAAAEPAPHRSEAEVAP